MKRVYVFLVVSAVALVLAGCQQSGELGQSIEPSSGSVAVTETDPALAGKYEAYSQEAALAAAREGRSVLFFHANWCPTCRAAEADITSHPEDIPSDLTIFKTDYDTETALKKKYNIVSQHTFVQIDSEGNEITKWNGGNLADIIEMTDS